MARRHRKNARISPYLMLCCATPSCAAVLDAYRTGSGRLRLFRRTHLHGAARRPGQAVPHRHRTQITLAPGVLLAYRGRKIRHGVSMTFSIDPDITRATTLDTSFYTEEAHFRRARERVFARSWQWLGPCGEVAQPGSVAPRELLPGLLNEPLMLSRTEGNPLRLPCATFQADR